MKLIFLTLLLASCSVQNNWQIEETDVDGIYKLTKPSGEVVKIVGVVIDDELNIEEGE